MALYLGNQKVKLNLNGIACKLNISLTTLITNHVESSSSEEYILKDSNGLLATKESE